MAAVSVLFSIESAAVSIDISQYAVQRRPRPTRTCNHKQSDLCQGHRQESSSIITSDLTETSPLRWGVLALCPEDDGFIE